MANPLTSSEIKAAQAFANAFNQVDKDDLLLDNKVEFFSKENNSPVLLLDGKFGLIKQDYSPPLSRYFGYSRDLYRKRNSGRLSIEMLKN